MKSFSRVTTSANRHTFTLIEMIERQRFGCGRFVAYNLGFSPRELRLVEQLVDSTSTIF